MNPEDITIQVSRSPLTIAYAARQGRKSGLYQNSFWMFYEILDTPKSIIKMATAMYNRKRVGVSIFWDWSMLPDYVNSGYENQLGCFVKPDFRRLGIGQMLVERMNIKDAVVGRGVAGSEDFWAKMRGDKLRFQ